jgi:hypothetical protein
VHRLVPDLALAGVVGQPFDVLDEAIGVQALDASRYRGVQRERRSVAIHDRRSIDRRRGPAKTSPRGYGGAGAVPDGGARHLVSVVTLLLRARQARYR